LLRNYKNDFSVDPKYSKQTDELFSIQQGLETFLPVISFFLLTPDSCLLSPQTGLSINMYKTGYSSLCAIIFDVMYNPNPAIKPIINLIK